MDGEAGRFRRQQEVSGHPLPVFRSGQPAGAQFLEHGKHGLRWSLRLLSGSEGFIVACVDGRGTGARGAEFEKCTYLRLGDLESKDQVETALYMGSLPYVDKDNIGIWGWSYGGFNTLMSMSEGRPVFKAGVAVAPPTCYRFYDTVYTER